MYKVLITNYVHQDLIARLEKLGVKVDYDPDFKYNSLPPIIDQYHGIVINTKIKMTKEMIDLGTKLKFIGRLGSGLDIIDLPYAKSKNIEVISTPEGNRNAVAEHVFTLVLALNNKLLRADKEVRQMIWNRENNRGMELENKTFGIVGLGNTGQALAAKLSPWTQEVLYFDKYLEQKPTHLNYLRSVSLEEVQRQADIISFHVPLTEETKHMINKEFIDGCKDGVVIVNTCRGKVAKTLDLIEGLERGKIGGLCMDVFENEKPASYTSEERMVYERLFRLENTVFSPHIAGWTKESLQKIGNIMADKVTEALELD